MFHDFKVSLEQNRKYLKVKTYLILTFCSFCYSFGIVFLLSKANTIPTGISAIPQILSYFFIELKPYITLIYLALNIPIILIFYTKVSKKFITRTLFWLISNSIFGFILGMNVVFNGISDFFTISNPGDTNVVISIIYTFLAILINGVAAGYTWKYGSSTGGTDIIAFYISSKYKKNIGFFLRIIAIFISTIGISILYGFGKYKYFMGVETICSFLYIFLNSFIINQIYPKYKKILLRIDSKNFNKIINLFDEISFNHPYRIIESTSGYLKTKNISIESVILLFELPEIRKKVLAIDSKAWISTVPVHSINGSFNYSFYEKN